MWTFLESGECRISMRTVARTLPDNSGSYSLYLRRLRRRSFRPVPLRRNTRYTESSPRRMGTSASSCSPEPDFDAAGRFRGIDFPCRCNPRDPYRACTESLLPHRALQHSRSVTGGMDLQPEPAQTNLAKRP